MIYFFRAAGIPMVKVGFSGDPKKRLNSLRTLSPVRIELAAIDERGDLLTELEFMDRFSDWRSHGEWFHDVGPVKRAVDFTAAVGSLPDAVYLPPHLKMKRGDLNFHTPTPRDLDTAFGLTRQDLVLLRGSRHNMGPDSQIAHVWLFPIRRFLQARGQDVSLHAILACRGAADAEASA